MDHNTIKNGTYSTLVLENASLKMFNHLSEHFKYDTEIRDIEYHGNSITGDIVILFDNIQMTIYDVSNKLVEIGNVMRGEQ